MIRVLQLIDSLEAGGAERLSISFANALTEEVDASFLCATRSEGILKSSISNSVNYLFLEKRSKIDMKAIIKLKRFVKDNKISIIHAHSTSFFLGFLVKLLYPKVRLIWHDHYGNSEFLNKRPKFALKFCSYFFSHTFCVNQILKNWSIEHLNCKNLSYLKNFVLLNDNEELTELKGVRGKRIVCLANLRMQKDHFNLLKAFRMLLENHPDWTLHCIGKDFKDDYSRKVYKDVEEKDLLRHVFFYGSCQDISYILSQCDIGVLSSKSEGLPIALLEYGFSNLGVVATDVGDCKLVIDSKDKGIIVPSQDSKSLYLALKRYVENPEERFLTAKRLHQYVMKEFSKSAIIDNIINVYNYVIK